MNPQWLLSIIPWRLLGYTVVVVAVAAGLFFAGANWKEAKIERQKSVELAAQMEAYKAKVQAEVQASQDINDRVVAEQLAEAKRNAEIKEKVVAHLQSRLTKTQEKVSELEKLGYGKDRLIEICTGGDFYRLDGWTLGMLHSAAKPSDSPDPAPRANEEGGTFTDVGGQALIEYQLKVVEMYKTLAKRHDELVEWIQNKQKEVNGNRN